MRIACALLSVALSGAVAHADDAKPADAAADAAATHDAKPAEARAKVPLRIVRMLPETHQALLFDKIKGTHVVVEAGQAVEGFVVDSIDADEVSLVADSGALVVLEAPEPAWRHHRDEGRARSTDSHPPQTRPATAARTGEPQPADPYADIAEPSTIGTGADGVRVVEAPDAPAYGAAPTSAPAYGAAPTTLGTGADGVRVVEAPGAPAAPAPAAVSAAAPAAVSAAAPAAVSAAAPAAVSSSSDSTGDTLAAALTGAPAVPSTTTQVTASPAATPPATSAPAASDGPVVLARGDVSAALGNFGTLAGSIKGAFTPSGVRVDSVAAGSLFAKAGLRSGDVIATVDNVPLRSLDDAADLYARAARARNVSVALVRAGKPVTLRVTIQ